MEEEMNDQPAAPGRRTWRRRIAALGVALTLGVSGAVVIAAAPAQAAVPDVWAFAYQDNPTPPAGWVMDTTRQWGTWRSSPTLCATGAWATVTEVAVGRYQVLFPCTPYRKGVVHVTTVDYKGRYCDAGGWGTAGTSLVANVYCFAPGGSPDHATFTVLYTASTPAPLVGGSHTYVYADPTGAALTSFNSTGLGVSVGHMGVGQYAVKLPGLAAGALQGDLQATAVTRLPLPRRCKIARWGYSGTDYVAYVFCFDGASNPVDTWWTLSYHNKRAVFGALAPPKNFGYVWSIGAAVPPPATNFNSVGAANSVTPVGGGEYLVQYQNVGYRSTHMQVTAYGDGPGYCGLSWPWQLVGTLVYAKTVICFDGLGNRKDSSFFATYTSNV
jgi:hypothetical protein